MQDHPNPEAPFCAPSSDSVGHRAQRWVLLELVTAPPPEGDEIARIAFGLKELRADVEAGRQRPGHCRARVRDGDRVHATPAALRFDKLWPART